MNPYAPVDVTGHVLKRRYRQSGHDLERKSMAQVLSDKSASRKAIRQARVLQGFGLVMAAAGGGLLGWTLGQLAVGEEEPDSKLAIVGGSLIGVSLCFGLGADARFNAAVTAHNRSFGGEP